MVLRVAELRGGALAAGSASAWEVESARVWVSASRVELAAGSASAWEAESARVWVSASMVGWTPAWVAESVALRVRELPGLAEEEDARSSRGARRR